MNEVSYIVDTTLQPQVCFGVRILMSNLRSPLMKIISTPLLIGMDITSQKACDKLKSIIGSSGTLNTLILGQK